ncbi:hypothetical protein LCGC14_1927270, partial [marine sediment metagenome]
KEIVPIWKAIRKGGYKYRHKSDYEHGQTRSYDFGTLVLIVFMKSDGACRFIKTGTTMIETTQYELRCNGEKFENGMEGQNGEE